MWALDITLKYRRPRKFNLPAMLETWVPFLGWEDPLEKGMATHSSNLDWRIPRTKEPGRLQPMGSQATRAPPWLTGKESPCKQENGSLSVLLTLCDLMDCNLPASSVHGIFQARILE